MKKISFLLLMSLFANTALADCNWGTGITPLSGGGYVYSNECHLAVGKLVQDAKVKDQQIADLTAAIQLKDLAITKSDARTNLWMDTSDKLQDRVEKIDSIEHKSEFLYFALGALATIGAGFMTARILGK